MAKRLFISQPMRGKSDEEIIRERETAVRAVQEHLHDEVVLIDSFFQGAHAGASPLWYLGESLNLLATADVACFAPGWLNARGCRIEHTCAIEYGIQTMEIDDIL